MQVLSKIVWLLPILLWRKIYLFGFIFRRFDHIFAYFCDCRWCIYMLIKGKKTGRNLSQTIGLKCTIVSGHQRCRRKFICGISNIIYIFSFLVFWLSKWNDTYIFAIVWHSIYYSNKFDGVFGLRAFFVVCVFFSSFPIRFGLVGRKFRATQNWDTTASDWGSVDVNVTMFACVRARVCLWLNEGFIHKSTVTNCLGIDKSVEPHKSN